ncbi:serine/threonine-protein phosphatase [Planosporangium flavigriseum]|uniref:PP2C family protein-serine/threonine phosphatase n=1 Tax=Planosporangium flavigriseum TaxID=373681 RepID=UPI00143BA68B|nr:protein phosphatase 2C domain-containing protein [Planosporangium flavigriseum]NJC67120.1 serine/threonine-protein phosphatase [Planosporangium flavigriseum]
MSIVLRFGARSDRGAVRPANQDSAYVGPRLLVIADGMGGMAAGDLASRLTIVALAPLDRLAATRALEDPNDTLVDSLQAVAEDANRRIRDEVAANPALDGMGTTLTAVLLAGGKISMVHVGDSRAYRLRDGELQQVTKDDTYVQMLLDEGAIGPDEAAAHPHRSVVTRALQGRQVEARYSVRPAVIGDRYLLCSDGLSEAVSADAIAAALKGLPDPQACADQLVAMALHAGATDNVTVIVGDVVEAETGSEQQPGVLGAAAEREPAMDGPA